MNLGTARGSCALLQQNTFQLPTLEDIIQPYQHFPKTIQQALLRAHTHPTFVALTKCTRKVLCALLTRADQFNGQHPIRARLDLVAEEINVSEKSVRRAIQLFMQLGWLSSASEGRNEFGVFCSRRYQLSIGLCELVELPIKQKTQTTATSSQTVPPVMAGRLATTVHDTPEVKQEDAPSTPAANKIPETKQGDAQNSRQTEMSAGAVYVDLSYKKDLREISIKNRKDNPIVLPEQLLPIIALGIKDTGVCKLRGLAHAAGYQLEDIYRVAKQRLQEIGATGGRAYRYLLALIMRPSDYAGRAGQMARQERDTKQLQHQVDRAVKYRHKRFNGPMGAKVQIWDGIAEIALPNGKFTMVAGPALQQLYNDIDAGVLKEVVQ